MTDTSDSSRVYRATAGVPNPLDSNSAGCLPYIQTASDPSFAIIGFGGSTGDAATTRQLTQMQVDLPRKV